MMKDYRSVEERFEFSPQVSRLHQSLLGRLLPFEYREGTHTGGRPDGKTPFLDTFERMADAPYSHTLATAIVESWLQTKPVIREDDVLVGVVRPDREMNEHFSWGVIYNDPELLNDPAYEGRKDEIWDRIQKIWPKAEPLNEKHRDDEGDRIFGKEVYRAMRGAVMSPGGYQGHTVPNYPKLLDLGVGGLLQEIRKYSSNTNDEKKQELYEALRILMTGFSDFIMLYANTARKLAEEAADSAKKENYTKIANNCASIALEAPTTLYQAAQLMWFYCMWDCVDCTGRVDQYLYPFFLESLNGGDVFSVEDIVSSLWLKIFENGSHNVTLAGVRPKDGKDATNELTYLILQISRTIHNCHPRLSVRIHKNSSEKLLQLVVQMWSEGMSDPSVVSDENVIPALQEYGVSLRDARDYSMLGCQEIEIPGKSNFGCEDGKFNLAKVFEYTINDGKCRFTGQQCGLKTGKLTDFHNIDELWDAFMAQMRYFTEPFIYLCNRGVDIRNANISKMVKMPLTDDCLSRGLNLDDGGAMYNYGVIETAGSSAVADAFAAIQTLVFDKKLISMETLEKAIDANFEGYEKERQMLLRMAPKFGNDNELADSYAVRILEEYWSELGKYKSVRGGVFTGACSLLGGGVHYGSQTWAMPDGRFKGEPLGNTIGPRPGADKSGTTAMLNSVAKLPLKKGIGGTTLNVLLPRKLMQTEAERAKIVAMMRTYLLNGGQMAQITTADLEDMVDALDHPERHENLIVRIGGFSAKFNEFGREEQLEFISRYGQDQ